MKYNIKKFKKDAIQLRQKTFLHFIESGEAHLGGSFSIIEILIYLLKFLIKKHHKFILSKAHASIPFCILLREFGNKNKLSTHLEIDPKNGIHCTTGSLGHGLPISVGMALANKKQRLKRKIYTLISDGECQEGTTWESFLIISRHNLNNLIVLIDYNKIQALTSLDEALPLGNLKKKIESFNINCIDVRNGHSFSQIHNAFSKLKKNKPNCIILNTTKSKGIKTFENDPIWHARKIKGNDILIGKIALGLK
tara:strand:- start:800 stop:1555 length:756 start_codon:yes stop_codon:yes gene_type:complete